MAYSAVHFKWKMYYFIGLFILCFAICFVSNLVMVLSDHTSEGISLPGGLQSRPHSESLPEVLRNRETPADGNLR